MKERYKYEDFVLNPHQLRCYRSRRGGMVMVIGDEEYHDVNIRRAFPLEAADRFIGFFLPDGTELGLVENLDTFDKDSLRIVFEELDKVYFRPTILRFDHLSEEFGVVQADVETTSGPRSIEIRGIRSNIRLLSHRRALIEDVDGNRYELRDYHRLPKLTREILGL